MPESALQQRCLSPEDPDEAKNPASELSPVGVELTVLMPCLNEALTLPACIGKAQRFLDQMGVAGEVLIADNGSTDGSQQLARKLGARVIDVPKRGYGAALLSGIESAKGRFIVMGDSDDSYDFEALEPFLRELRSGAQLVMGNRFAGGIRPGAMPALHRYLGNPVLSFIGRLLFRTPIGDFHCGLRGFRRDAILGLNLRCDGMEFASEMVVKASLDGLSIVEVPVVLSPDGRDRPPHLRSWRDGWRHLRFLLIFSPRWLYLYPGATLFALGALGLVVLATTPVRLGSLTLDIHTLLYAAAATVTGCQLLMFAVFAKVFAVEHGILPEHPLLSRMRRGPILEIGLLVGVALIAAGMLLSLRSVLAWNQAAFGAFDPAVGMRMVIPATTVATLGVQILFSSMFLGVLGLRTHARSE